LPQAQSGDPGGDRASVESRHARNDRALTSSAQVFWILLASFLFATMSALIKVAAADFSIPEIVLFRTLPGALVLLAYARVRRLTILPQNWRLHAIRSAVGVGSMGLSFYAIARLPLATAATLDYTSPIFMVLYIVVATRHRLRPAELGALFGGFAGVLLLLRPALQGDQTMPFIAGLASGALGAAAYWQIGRLGRAGEPEWRIVLLYSMATTTIAALVIPLSPPSTPTLRGGLALLGVGACGLVAQLAMTRAFSRGSPTLVSSLQYSGVAFAAFYGFAFWGDRLSVLGLLGLALIVLSGIIAASTTSAFRMHPARPEESR